MTTAYRPRRASASRTSLNVYSISTFCLLPTLVSEGALTLPYSRLSVSSSSLRRLRYAPKSGAKPAAPLLAAEDAEEESFPTPALVLRAVTSSAEVAFHTASPEPTASTAAVSVNEPKSPEPDRELTWQSRPRAAEQEAASPAVGTLKRPLVSLRGASESGALQSWKTLPSIRILSPASTSKLWLCSGQWRTP